MRPTHRGVGADGQGLRHPAQSRSIVRRARFADLYAVTGAPRWRAAAERDWNIFMERYRLPTAAAEEVLEPACNRDEGCAECDWLRLNLSLWRLTGNGRCLDAAERCLKGHFSFNQFPKWCARDIGFASDRRTAGGFLSGRRGGLLVLQRTLGEGPRSMWPGLPSLAASTDRAST